MESPLAALGFSLPGSEPQLSRLRFCSSVRQHALRGVHPAGALARFLRESTIDFQVRQRLLKLFDSGVTHFTTREFQ